MKKYLMLLLFSMCVHAEESKPFVIGVVHSQLGNNLFQVATTCALAWDNGAEPYFPHLSATKVWNIPANYAHVLFRCNATLPPGEVSMIWTEPSAGYHPISYCKNMALNGYFQSEKYFAHHRKRILELFAPRADDLEYMKTKYKWLIDHPCTVGVQIRQMWEEPEGVIFNQYGKDYLTKAMALFPENALFVISANNHEFARENIPDKMKNYVFLKDEPHYIDLYLLSYCKHNIITNSTFGWWAAWLNENPNRKIVTPSVWENPTCDVKTKDIYPDGWVKVDAKSGPLKDPKNYR